MATFSAALGTPISHDDRNRWPETRHARVDQHQRAKRDQREPDDTPIADTRGEDRGEDGAKQQANPG